MSATYDTAINYPINLATDHAVIIDGALTGSEVCITHAIMDTDKRDTGVLTSGYPTNNGGTDPNDFFHYEGPSNFVMVLNSDGEPEVVNVYAGLREYLQRVKKFLTSGMRRFIMLPESGILSNPAKIINGGDCYEETGFSASRPGSRTGHGGHRSG